MKKLFTLLMCLSAVLVHGAVPEYQRNEFTTNLNPSARNVVTQILNGFTGPFVRNLNGSGTNLSQFGLGFNRGTIWNYQTNLQTVLANQQTNSSISFTQFTQRLFVTNNAFRGVVMMDNIATIYGQFVVSKVISENEVMVDAIIEPATVTGDTNHWEIYKIVQGFTDINGVHVASDDSAGSRGTLGQPWSYGNFYIAQDGTNNYRMTVNPVGTFEIQSKRNFGTVFSIFPTAPYESFVIESNGLASTRIGSSNRGVMYLTAPGSNSAAVVSILGRTAAGKVEEYAIPGAGVVTSVDPTQLRLVSGVLGITNGAALTNPVVYLPGTSSTMNFIGTSQNAGGLSFNLKSPFGGNSQSDAPMSISWQYTNAVFGWWAHGMSNTWEINNSTAPATETISSTVPVLFYGKRDSKIVGIGRFYAFITNHAHVVMQSNLIVNGNVGIGTATPGSTLQLNNGEFLIPDGSATQPAIGFGSRTNNGIWFVSAGVWALGAEGSQVALVNKAGSTARFTVADQLDVTGKVGIGSTAPAAKLDVVGSVNVATNLIVTNGISSLRSNLLAATVITVSGSPYHFTNTTGANINVALSGGEVSGLAVNGTFWADSGVTFALVPLQPNQWLSITNLSVPKMAWKPE